LLNDLVHSPPIELVISYNAQRHIVLHRIPLHSFQTVVSVAFYPFINGEEYEFDAIVMSLVEGFKHRCEHSTVFTSASAYGYALAAVKEPACSDRMMYFFFEDAEEAGLAQLGVVFRSENDSTVLFAESARRRRHGRGHYRMRKVRNMWRREVKIWARVMLA